MQRRRTTYKKHWARLIDIYGTRCVYCGKQPATCIDHIIPYSYSADNSINNLVPACILCNLTATDKVFDSFEHKRQYIRNKIKNKNNQHAICVDCLLPFVYRTHSPSLFMCAECYDLENGTKLSKKDIWKKWLKLLDEAGIEVGAHRNARQRIELSHDHDMKSKTEILLDEYFNCFNSDADFAQDLISHEINEASAIYTT